MKHFGNQVNSSFHRAFARKRGLAVLLVLCFWLLAVVTPTLSLDPPTRTSPPTVVRRADAALPAYLTVIVSALLVAAFFYFLVPVLDRLKPRKRKENQVIQEMPKPRIRGSVFLVLLFLAGMGVFWWGWRQFSPSTRPPATAVPAARPLPESAAVSGRRPAAAAPEAWLGYAGLALVLVAALLWALLLAAELRRRRVGKPLETMETPAGRQEIPTGRSEGFETNGDPTDTVLLCYREMCLFLRPWHPSDDFATAREFVQSLQQAGVHCRQIESLTRLFERVRYGRHPADEREKIEATRALQEIRRQFGSQQDGS